MRKLFTPIAAPGGRSAKVLAGFLAACCAAVFYARVYTDFPRVRITLLDAAVAPVGGSVRVDLPDLSALDEQATAIIVRLSNTQRGPLPVSVFSGGDEVARFVVGAGREERIDLSVANGARLAADNVLELRSEGDQWSPEYVELANVHGHSTGLMAFVVAPATASNYPRTTGVGAAVLFLGLLVLGAFWRRIETRAVRLAHAVAAGSVVSVFGLALLAPWVSDYKFLVSLQAFLICITVLYVPALHGTRRAASAALVAYLEPRVMRWWQRPASSAPSRLGSWRCPGAARRRFCAVTVLLLTWVLTHVGNFAAGADFVPSINSLDDPGVSVVATGRAADRCPGCSVVLISIDTLRADHLGSYAHTRDTSPNIDAFSDRATRFTTTIAPASSTLKSHASMMTSLLTMQHGASINPTIPLTDEALTLAEILRDDGYQTAAFTSSGQLASEYGLSQGFDLYSAEHRRDFQTTVDASMAWLDARPRGKFFLFMHTYEVHAPYTPHERYWRLLGVDGGTEMSMHVSVPEIDELNTRDADGRPGFTEADARRLGLSYDAEIRSVDDAFDRLLSELRKRGVYDNVMLILTSDHGEAFAEHGLIGRHHGSGYDEVLRVPLIIKFPRASFSARTVDTQVRTIDIAPTILDVVAGAQPPSFVGSSLVGLVEGGDDGDGSRIAVSLARAGVVAIRTDRWKYFDGQLFDLQADPSELHDVGRLFPAVRAWMRVQEGMLVSLPTLNSAAAQPSEEALRQLRALGYIR